MSTDIQTTKSQMVRAPWRQNARKTLGAAPAKENAPESSNADADQGIGLHNPARPP